MLTYLINQQPPTLNELNQFSNTYIYEVGYFIADFIVKTKGSSALHELIKNHGNLKETLNMGEEEFTKQWFAFVKTKYGLRMITVFKLMFNYFAIGTIALTIILFRFAINK